MMPWGSLTVLCVVAALVAGCGAGATSSTSSAPASVSESGTVATGTTGVDGIVTIPGPVEARGIPQPPVPPAGSCHYRREGADVLPDPKCTPGGVDAAVSSSTAARTICVSGYTAKVRPPTSYTDPLKRRLMAAYGVRGSPSGYELDHLVSLELGGAPADPANLWPEPYAGAGGARVKDRAENATRREACAHPSELGALQAAIARDWTTIRTGGQ
jgi:hypothetical protein